MSVPRLKISKVPPLTPELANWSDITDYKTSLGLLIGNGASRAVWDGFAYESLYLISKKLAPLYALSDEDTKLFDEFSTTNFEGVLQSLHISDKVMTALGRADPLILEKYHHIRTALVQSVHQVHIKHSQIPESTLTRISNELERYNAVFSTNYDLLIYWSIMHANTNSFKDYFWSSGNSFDISDTDVSDAFTKILYLHGALHLYFDGDTKKLGNDIMRNFADGGRVPLFVSEGTATDKEASIQRSDYLSFAYYQLSQFTQPLAIFGQGLGDNDSHLCQAIRKHKARSLKIGIYPSDDQSIIAMKAHYRKVFPDQELEFFASTSHPLGASDLKVEP